MHYKRFVWSRRVGFLLRNSLRSALKNSNSTLNLRPNVQQPHAFALYTQKTHLKWDPDTLLWSSLKWFPCTHSWPPCSQFTEHPEALHNVRCIMLSSQKLLMAPFLTQNEIQSPHSKDLHGLESSYSSWPLSFAHSPPAILASSNTPNTLLLWNLWTCYFLSLECSSPYTHMACSSISFRYLLKCHIIRESFPGLSF